MVRSVGGLLSLSGGLAISFGRVAFFFFSIDRSDGLVGKARQGKAGRRLDFWGWFLVAAVDFDFLFPAPFLFIIIMLSLMSCHGSVLGLCCCRLLCTLSLSK